MLALNIITYIASSLLETVKTFETQNSVVHGILDILDYI